MTYNGDPIIMNMLNDDLPQDTPQAEADNSNAALDTANMAEVYDLGAEAFQRQAPNLLSWQAVGKPALERALAPVFARSDLSTIRVLDEGSASGRIVEFLIGLGVPADHIDGVEISPEQVARAQAAIPEAHFRVGNLSMATDPLPAGEYDVVTRHMVDEHLNNDQLLDVSRNTLNGLKPGGTLAVVFTHPDRVMHTEGSKIRPNGSYTTTFPWGGEGENYYRTVEQYLGILKEAGFDIESTENLPVPQGESTEAINPATYQSYVEQGYMDTGNGQPLNVRLAVVARRPA